MSDRSNSGADLERWVDELKQGIRTEKNRDEICLFIRPWIYSFFKKRLRDSNKDLQDCEDLTHEVITKVLGNIEKCQSASTFRSWLFAIATNTYRNWLSSGHFDRRTSQTSIEVLAEQGREIPDSAEVLADDYLLQKEGHQRIRQLISEMPEQMSQCASLHFLEGYSYKRIAILLRIKEPTVRVQIHNARRRLRKHSDSSDQN